MDLFQIGILLFELPFLPTSKGSWTLLTALIVVIILIVFLAYSYVFDKKKKEQQLANSRNINQHDTKEDKDEARK